MSILDNPNWEDDVINSRLYASLGKVHVDHFDICVAKKVSWTDMDLATYEVELGIKYHNADDDVSWNRRLWKNTPYVKDGEVYSTHDDSHICRANKDLSIKVGHNLEFIPSNDYGRLIVYTEESYIDLTDLKYDLFELRIAGPNLRSIILPKINVKDLNIWAPNCHDIVGQLYCVNFVEMNILRTSASQWEGDDYKCFIDRYIKISYMADDHRECVATSIATMQPLPKILREFGMY